MSNELVIKSIEEHLTTRVFGNPGIAQDWEETKSVISKTSHLGEVWCRSRTAWHLENITLTSGGRSPWKRIRQISSEIDNRKMAMTDAKWAMLKLDAQIASLQAKIQSTPNPQDSIFLQLEIGEKEEHLQMILLKFQGAMRDIRDLGVLYDSLVKDLGSIDEDAVNEAERRAHLHRALTQSIRDLRQTGVITAGNQEYLEQCGVNPGWVLPKLITYLETDSEYADVSYQDAIVETTINEIVG